MNNRDKIVTIVVTVLCAGPLMYLLLRVLHYKMLLSSGIALVVGCALIYVLTTKRKLP